MHSRIFAIACLGWVSFFVTSCGERVEPPVPETPAAPTTAVPLSPTQPEPTPTPFLPSPTPIPLAAFVNGEAISLAEYQEELARYHASAGETDVEDGDLVLDQMIDQLILAQAAAQAGFELDNAALQRRYDQLVDEAGGEPTMQAWMARTGYTEATFLVALRRAAAAAWMRDQVIAAVPPQADQVHARQILLYNEDEANQVLSQIETGTDFATLSKRYDPVLGGDLAWFPQGYLLESLIEQAAFALQPGEVSQVIETRLGFHIIEVIERDPQRHLDPDARLVLQEAALQQWLEQRRSQSEIQILVSESSS